eukprot:2368506-Pleurochrysis_carterae.AAC.3
MIILFLGGALRSGCSSAAQTACASSTRSWKCMPSPVMKRAALFVNEPLGLRPLSRSASSLRRAQGVGGFNGEDRRRHAAAGPARGVYLTRSPLLALLRLGARVVGRPERVGPLVAEPACLRVVLARVRKQQKGCPHEHLQPDEQRCREAHARADAGPVVAAGGRARDELGALEAENEAHQLKLLPVLHDGDEEEGEEAAAHKDVGRGGDEHDEQRLPVAQLGPDGPVVRHPVVDHEGAEHLVPAVHDVQQQLLLPEKAKGAGADTARNEERESERVQLRFQAHSRICADSHRPQEFRARAHLARESTRGQCDVTGANATKRTKNASAPHMSRSSSLAKPRDTHKRAITAHRLRLSHPSDSLPTRELVPLPQLVPR